MFGSKKRNNERPGDFGGTSFDLIGEGDPDGFYVSDLATSVRHLSELALADTSAPAECVDGRAVDVQKD